MAEIRAMSEIRAITVPELNKVSHTDGRSVQAEINVSRHLEGSIRLAMTVLFRFSILKWLEGYQIK